ncbi:non-ribosomal peptide synthetase [Crocosphaera chwakensis]|uniref:Amino acid adenylation n=1 Tax=Crocosphaera chwakensis CCY0110 TaxID=391612 RepID=A3INW9_9CHRO|nr:non-ribosomal peptide synthetase [Crocosphaera chwakensis]EAZ91771.1 Amino acid adenylation [Crocosphaera chwakensis CCY0110]
MTDFETSLSTDMNEGFRLSPQQERTWLLQGLEFSYQYQVNGSLSIKGNLDIERLKMAIYKVMERHEILRTIFPCLPGMNIPFQQILTISKLDWQEEDLRETDHNKGFKRLNIIQSQFAQIPFNFDKAPPIKFKLVRLLDDKFCLLIRLSALCGDSHSFNIFIQEIVEAYQHYETNKKLPEVEIQYADIAEWFHELLEDEEGAIARSFWREKGEQYEANPSLVIEEYNQQSFDFTPQLERIELSSELWDKIKKFVDSYDISLENFFYSSFITFIYKITGKASFFFGRQTQGRSYEELEQGIGLFTKYLPNKIELNETSIFLEILELNQLNDSENKKWQDYFTWDNFQEKEKNINQTILSYSFEWYEYPPENKVSDVSFSLIDKTSVIEPFILKLVVQYQDSNLKLFLAYDNYKFDSKTIKKLCNQYKILLNDIIVKASSPINQLNILSEEDKENILNKFNQNSLKYSIKNLVYQQFEKQAIQKPEHLALIDENQSLTYEELNQKSNQLAHYLIKKGVKPDCIVPLLVERSVDFIVGMLAILKAGGAYLPLDATLPLEALKLRVEDAQASLIITQNHLKLNLADLSLTILNLDQEQDNIAQESTENPNIPVAADNLVYVIYTSGSTGKPKGVGVEHKQLYNYVYGIQDKLDLPPESHFANVSSFAADLGNTVIFPPLCTGGCVHIISQDRIMDAEGFAEYCDHHPIDCLKIVPSHLSTLLIAAKHPEKILPKKRLILGGEASNWQLIKKIKQYAPDCCIYNHYGPTETTIGVLTYSVTSDEPVSDLNTVPLGTPLPNTQMYILDRYLQPVPIGVTGELYIGGDNLSRGYLNQPELTEERFIENPFDKQTKLYKTGDLARYFPDGTIEFLGRSDRQIKIRGFRIELGEVEGTLRQHPQIQEAVVTSWEASPGNPRLVAYLISSEEEKPENEILNHFLAQKLSDFMIPSHFLWLDTFPLTPNGKINYKALPSPDTSNSQTNYIAPKTAIEEILCNIWQDLLSLEKVGVNHSFFDLGGHSLLATQLISRIRQTFRAEITLRDLFDDPTISHLSQTLVSREPKPGQTEKIAQTLKKLNSLSPEEKQRLLAQKRQGGQA